jgi:hypothetical protein
MTQARARADWRRVKEIDDQIDVTPMELRVTLTSLDRNPFAEPYDKRGAIVTAGNIESEFTGFAGGASGFGDPEFVELLRHESVVPGTGLSVGALQSVARRQFVGSVVVAIGIVAIAALTAFRPAHLEASKTPSHNFAIVQQPSFVTQHYAATKQHELEVP